MKTRKTKLARMLELGLIHSNEAVTEVTSTDTGGGGAPTSETEGESVSTSEIDWGTMLDDPSESEPSSQAEETIEDTGDSAAEQQVPAAEPQAPAETAVVTPQEPPADPITPTEPAPVVEAAQEPTEPQLTDEQVASRQAEARNNWLEQLAAGYQMSEEQVTAFSANPGETLPRLAADIHANIMDNTMQFLRNQLPGIIEQTNQLSSQRQESVDAFFTAWPELKEHSNVVTQMGKFWREQNPNGTREEFIAQVGSLAWSAAGLSPNDLVNRGAGVTETPAPVVSEGYSPAPSTTGPVTAVETAPPQNPFEALANQWIED